METLKGILFIIYLIAGYWAVGQTLFANRIIIGTWSKIFMEKFMAAFFLGFILMPIALFKNRAK